MFIGRIGCALGRHRVDRRHIQKLYGREVGRCKHCRRVMEQASPGEWVVTPLHDAGLGQRPR